MRRLDILRREEIGEIQGMAKPRGPGETPLPEYDPAMAVGDDRQGAQVIELR
jgi:hypothetical protein